jgi:hypothetical protein
MEPISGQCGCLKTYHAPRFISSDKAVTMPATGPNVEKFLNVDNLIMVTQSYATTRVHRDTFHEVARVVGIAANKEGARGEEAEEVLNNLKNNLLAQSVNIVIEQTHACIPKEYFVAMSPRYLTPPPGSQFSMLRLKIGNTKRLPYTCLELQSKNNTFLPWMTVDSKESGHHKCNMHFSDYAGLVRHLATRHYVLWLSFQCPWCENIGFEKTKITRHVASCKLMPKAVVQLVESVEKGDEASVIAAHVAAARSDLEKVIQNDSKYDLERRVSLTMTRAEALFRAYAEKSDKKNKKVRWPKSWKPDDERVKYEGELGVYCTKAHKFPFFAKCPGTCQRIFMDTQMASADHLSSCDLMGFANYHSQKALDEGVVDEVDRLIFKWKEDADKAVKDFIPEVTITVDGCGGSNIRKTKGDKLKDKLKDIIKNEAVAVKNNPTIRAKRFVKRNENKGIAGGMRVIYDPGQEKVKAELTEMVVNMPSFRKMVVKRKANLEDFSEENLKRKCTRRSSQKELFDDGWQEHLDNFYAWSKVDF